MADAFSTCLDQAMLAGGAGNLVIQNENTKFRKFAKLQKTYNFEQNEKKGDEKMDDDIEFDDFKDILDDI